MGMVIHKMKDMIADYMENGFLDNIIDMFKYDRNLFSFLPHLMADERTKVRLGTVALVEVLKEKYPAEIINAIPQIADLLKSLNPTIRADAAYLLGIIGDKSCLPYLILALSDEHALVREIAKEACYEVQKQV